MALDALPPLRDVIQRHGLQAKKSLGQNFLLDLNLTSRIARSAGDLTGSTVFEVGPGPGGLTRALLANGARKVIAVERDQRCLAALAEVSDAYPGRLDVIEGDALTTSWRDLAATVPDGPVKIVANLPYNIATPLLVGWLRAEPWPPFWSSLTLMFQREVALRIVAAADDEAYGRLGVLAGWRAQARILFDVARTAFVPPPAVTSSIVHLTPRVRPDPCDPDVLEKVVASAFGQRRKMLRSSLKSITPQPDAMCAAAGIDPTRRAETLTVAEFAALANAYAAL
jgi:16S rRNA (adenine1518-N6/adenine1519-N6)-dimethyltransferase